MSTQQEKQKESTTTEYPSQISDSKEESAGFRLSTPLSASPVVDSLTPSLETSELYLSLGGAIKPALLSPSRNPSDIATMCHDVRGSLATINGSIDLLAADNEIIELAHPDISSLILAIKASTEKQLLLVNEAIEKSKIPAEAKSLPLVTSEADIEKYAREILQAVQTIKKIIEELGLLRGEIQEYLTAAIEGVDQQLILVSSMSKLILAPVVPKELMESVRRMHSSQAKLKDISLKFVINIQDEHAKFSLDRQKLLRALNNLVGNALKFTEKGGEIVIALQQKAGDVLTFSVQDNGQGMSADNVDKLFRPFYQVPGDHKEHGGSGLGLFISKQLVELHGGKMIRPDSEIGRGTRFIFEVPAKKILSEKNKMGSFLSVNSSTIRRKRTTSLPVAFTPFENIDPLKILVIDDNQINAGILVKNIQRTTAKSDQAQPAHQCHLASNYAAAIAQWETGMFDLILTDKNLGKEGENGIDICREIRKREAKSAKRIPIIGLSGDADGADCLEAGMDAYFTKPYNWEELARWIKQHTTHILPGSHSLPNCSVHSQLNITTSRSYPGFFPTTVTPSNLPAEPLVTTDVLLGAQPIDRIEVEMADSQEPDSDSTVSAVALSLKHAHNQLMS